MADGNLTLLRQIADSLEDVSSKTLDVRAALQTRLITCWLLAYVMIRLAWSQWMAPAAIKLTKGACKMRKAGRY